MVLINLILEVGGVDLGSGWVIFFVGERLVFYLREEFFYVRVIGVNCWWFIGVKCRFYFGINF